VLATRHREDPHRRGQLEGSARRDRRRRAGRLHLRRREPARRPPLHADRPEAEDIMTVLDPPAAPHRPAGAATPPAGPAAPGPAAPRPAAPRPARRTTRTRPSWGLILSLAVLAFFAIAALLPAL